MTEVKKIFCKTCGAEVQEGQKFCHECGSPLNDVGTATVNVPDTTVAEVPPIGIMPMQQDPVENYPKGPDDSGLKIIVDYCRKTLATAMGDGHDETVLYLDEKTGRYQIHVYSRPVGASSELHKGFAADPEVYDAVMKHIDETDLAGYEGKQGMALCGGETVVKFLKGEKMIRVTTDNVDFEHHSDLDMVGSILGSYIDKEKELH